MENKINGKNPSLESKSINDYVYFNDEWNGQWVNDPKKEIEIKEVGNKFQWINPVHWLYEMYFMGKITREELNIKLKSL